MMGGGGVALVFMIIMMIMLCGSMAVVVGRRWRRSRQAQGPSSNPRA
jgi:hypothetical protein